MQRIEAEKHSRDRAAALQKVEDAFVFCQALARVTADDASTHDGSDEAPASADRCAVYISFFYAGLSHCNLLIRLMAAGSALGFIVVLVISAPAAATADSNLRSQHRFSSLVERTISEAAHQGLGFASN